MICFGYEYDVINELYWKAMGFVSIWNYYLANVYSEGEFDYVNLGLSSGLWNSVEDETNVLVDDIVLILGKKKITIRDAITYPVDIWLFLGKYASEKDIVSQILEYSDLNSMINSIEIKSDEDKLFYRFILRIVYSVEKMGRGLDAVEKYIQ